LGARHTRNYHTFATRKPEKENAPLKDRIKQLLGEGLNPSVVANAVGCTPGFVSQLLADENFKQDVTELRVSKLTAATGRDRRYDNVEDTLLGKLETAIPLLFRPVEILAALRIINQATRRGASADQAPVTYKTVVNLNLPEIARTKLVLNQDNQVIEIAGRAMATMPANVLLKQLGVEDAEQIPSFGPQRSEEVGEFVSTAIQTRARATR
jgi:hypothetical protein